MTRFEGLRIVSEWQAEKELISRGYRKVTCGACKGAGHFLSTDPVDASLLSPPPQHFWGTVCTACEGHGWRWALPVCAVKPPANPP